MNASVPSPFDLGGRRALVTGAGSGLGLAIARGLAEAGASVVLNGRTLAKLEAAAAAFRQDGLSVDVAAFDVADSAAVASGMADVQARIGTIDILVNTAGIQHRAPIDEFSDADWRRLMATNLDAPFFMARAVIPAMKAKGGGKIVNIASPYCIWVLKQASDKLPWELDEAARIDGASPLQLFRLVYLPL
ncbi:MAG: SDR family NAD(P)-dependent oxidoreductase, partial [Caldimonas sp.]